MISGLQSRDSATLIGVLTAAGVYLIYNNALPSGADIRAAAPHDEDIEASRKHAAITSAVLVGAVFLVARDLNSYIISGLGLLGIDYYFKHQNATHPATGKLDAYSRNTVAPDAASLHPLPVYTTDDLAS